MKNQFILTPYYIDTPLEGLENLRLPGRRRVNNPQLPDGKPQDRLVTLYQPLKELVARAINEDRQPVSIAGDCCTALAVLAGIQAAGLDPALIWFDAHGDFNTWETTLSGFLGGMPLAMLVGRGEQTIVEGIGLKMLGESAIILSDARDLDPAEKLQLESSQIAHYPSVADLLTAHLPENPLYIHFDTDVIDPVEAPAMNFLAAAGPSVETLAGVFRRLAGTGRIAAVSVSSWNPALDPDGQTEAVVMNLLESLVGSSLTSES